MTYFKMMKSIAVALVSLAAVSASENIHAVAATADIATPKDSELKVELYYESLCPGCQQFIEQSIGDMIKDPCFDAVNWTFVPYGNAEQTKDSTGKVVTRCQHGELECHRNKEELCVIKYLKDAPKQELTKTIMCMENHTDEDQTPVKTCVKGGKDLIQKIQTCSRSSEGDSLVNAAAKRTTAIPDRDYVPWVMINGKHGDEDSKLKEQLCEASGGKSKECCAKANWATKAVHDVENFLNNLFHKNSKKALKGSKYPMCPVEGVTLKKVDTATTA